MNDEAPSKRVLSITARPTPEQKKRFAAIAKAKGMSEQKLAGIVLEWFLNRYDLQENIWRHDRPEIASTDRLTIRLRPGDRQQLDLQCGHRHIKPSAYVASLVRAHLRGSTPVPAAELAVLKQAVSQLAATNRGLTQLVKLLNERAVPSEVVSAELDRTYYAVRDLEKTVHDFVLAANAAWETNRG